MNMRYSAVRAAGAYRDDRRLSVARIAAIDHAVVSLGDYAVGNDSGAKNIERFAMTQCLVAKVERVRMFGSAATDLVWTAEGSVTACVILSNKPWDTMAGVLIAREAGALVVDLDGAPHTVDLARRSRYHPSLLTSCYASCGAYETPYGSCSPSAVGSLGIVALPRRQSGGTGLKHRRVLVRRPAGNLDPSSPDIVGVQ